MSTNSSNLIREGDLLQIPQDKRTLAIVDVGTSVPRLFLSLALLGEAFYAGGPRLAKVKMRWDI